MSRGRNVRKIPAAPKPKPSQKSARPVTSRGARKEVSKSTSDTPLPRPQRTIRSSLRSCTTTDSQAQPIQVDPEALLRKARKARRQSKAAGVAEAQEIPEEQYTQDRIRNLAQSIEFTLAGISHRVEDSDDNEVSKEEEEYVASQDTDPEQEFNRSWGYLPPLGDEAAAIIEAIIANPEMAKSYERIDANHRDFPRGLQRRNVLLKESNFSDPYADDIRDLTSPVKETEAESESHGQLWTLDKKKINQGSNEALFQRTLMMDLIGRHLFIYKRRDVNQTWLDFSVEELWTCPPMPTRSYYLLEKFLSQPKPDLAVCFHREAVISDELWNDIPGATQNLACYEGVNEAGLGRVFHFLTVEAKREQTSTNDRVAKFQSLNNASQALHNMFEFFRDAGQADTFFANVRFFSVVSSTEGLLIRIHRATRVPDDGSGQGFILRTPERKKDYPLQFEYNIFVDIRKADFVRSAVLKTFENILIGYGKGVLCGLISSAAQAIVNKIRDPQEYEARCDLNFYRYGQTVIKPESRYPTLKQTPVQSRSESVQVMSIDLTPGRRPIETPSQEEPSHLNVSIDMMERGTTTPIQSQPLVPEKTIKGKGKKRPTSSSQDTWPASRPVRKQR